MPDRFDRHVARILAMQALCHLDVQGEAGLREIGPFLADAEDDAQETLVYADRCIRSAWAARATTDALMQQQAHAWDVARMSPVERNVIRVALAELREGTLPANVVFDEAIEIAREFSTPEAAKFVHGLLDATWKAWQLETRDLKLDTRDGPSGFQAPNTRQKK